MFDGVVSGGQGHSRAVVRRRDDKGFDELHTDEAARLARRGGIGAVRDRVRVGGVAAPVGHPDQHQRDRRMVSLDPAARDHRTPLRASAGR